MNDKETYRHEALRFRDRIDPGLEDMEEASRLFFVNIQPQKGAVIAAYWPKGREFDPRPILEDCLKAGHVCGLPVVKKGTKELDFARWDDQKPLEEGLFGIMQPVCNEKTEWLAPDILIVPLLAFDRQGHRLGYGGGYYDATIKALRAKKSVLTVGVGYAQQAVLFNLPTDEHDQKLDWVITPQKAHKFM